MRIQIWSYNYDPEPQGIGPLSAMLARSLHARGHDVLVVAAHPHYPEPRWRTPRRPYAERRDGIRVLRLPLWIGRQSGKERIRQEVSFAASQAAIAPLLPRADVLIGVTPCFPALAVAMMQSRVRRTPWVMWLQDIVTDGAVSTGLLKPGRLLDAATRFECATYKSANRIVVISDAFVENLRRKDVDTSKIVRIFNPASRLPKTSERSPRLDRPRILAMGNIGYSQGLDKIVSAFEASSELEARGAVLTIAGHGVASDEVRAQIHSDRVEWTGVLQGDELEPYLHTASLGLVSQRPDVAEFNLPSKLMNYLSYGVPVLASVRPESETANIIRASGAGWVTDASEPAAFAARAAELLGELDALGEASRRGRVFAKQHFSPDAVAAEFEAVLDDAIQHGNLSSG